jgi:hypothetical protein
MNTITIELCAEDRARLDRLAAALESRAVLTKHTPDDDIAPVAKTDASEQQLDDVQQKLAETLAKIDDAPKVEKPEPEPEPEPAVTEDDVRALIRQLIASGKKAEAKDIVNAHAPSITDIPADALPVVYEQLKQLAGV